MSNNLRHMSWSACLQLGYRSKFERGIFVENLVGPKSSAASKLVRRVSLVRLDCLGENNIECNRFNFPN